MYAEEAYLTKKFGKVYEDWARETPAFIPEPRKWRRSNLPFSVKNVLKREYNGFFVIVASMFSLELAGNLFQDGKPEIGPMWISILAAGFVIWATLRFMKKKTRLLHVEGR